MFIATKPINRLDPIRTGKLGRTNKYKREGGNMEEQETKINVLELDKDEQTKWSHEQNELGRTYKELAEILGVPESTLKSRIRTYRKNNGIMSTSSDVKKSNVNTNVQMSTQKKPNVITGQTKNVDFAPEEIEVLKKVISERKRDSELLDEYRVYKELDKVPTNEETIRSAFNMSKTTQNA